MKASEFLTEKPIAPVATDRRDLYQQAWRNEFVRPGELRVDVDDEYDANGEPFGDNTGIKKLGTGAEATVVKHKDENAVVKIFGTTQQIKHNAHLQYLLATKKYAAGNPYLPRVLSIQELPHPSDEHPDIKGYAIRIERLWHLAEVPDDARMDMLHKIYGDKVDPDTKVNFPSDFATAVRAGVLNKMPIIDPYFKQAANIIIGVYNKINTQQSFTDVFDLHSNNMMFRRTQFGWQLVISDPLYNGEEFSD